MAKSWHATGVYDQPSGRRFGPALIAFLVVLAGVSGTVGYFGARNIIASNGSPNANGGPSTGSTTRTPAAGATPTVNGGSSSSTPPSGASSGSNSGSTTGSGTGTVKPGDPTKCPKATADAVGAAGFDNNLQVVLYIHVRKAGQTDKEGWVCKNADGLLIYQGHDFSGVLDTADNAKNTLLLAQGIKGNVVDNGTEIVASNPGPDSTTTEYHLSKTRLFVVTQPNNVGGTTYQVVSSYP